MSCLHWLKDYLMTPVPLWFVYFIAGLIGAMNAYIESRRKRRVT